MIDIIHKGALTVERLFYYTKFKIKKPSHFTVMDVPNRYWYVVSGNILATINSN